MSEQKEQLVIDDRDETVCPICWERITDIGVTNTCRHRFCVSCLTEWTAQHNYCPLCRQLIEVVIAVTHRKYRNDFDLIVVDNDESKQRRKLMEQRSSLRQRLIHERDHTVEAIIELNQRLRDIDLGVQQLDRIRNENNATVYEIIDRIDGQRENFLSSRSDTNNNMVEVVTLTSAATQTIRSSASNSSIQTLDDSGLLDSNFGLDSDESIDSNITRWPMAYTDSRANLEEFDEQN